MYFALHQRLEHIHAVAVNWCYILSIFKYQGHHSPLFSKYPEVPPLGILHLSLGDIFYLLYYVTCRSEKLRLKNGFCLTSLQNCLFLVSSEFSEKIIILKHYSALLNYTKIKINMHIFWLFNFFLRSRSEKFQLI